MLQVNNLSGFGAERDSHRLYDIINRSGLLGSCVVCLDAADPASYTSGQTITDRVGGNNYFLGATNAVEASDPTFVGTAGDPAAYFSFDGGDYFARTAAQVFDATWHQAGGRFTLLNLFYPLAVKASDTCMWGNRNNTAANAGVMIECVDDYRIRLRKSYTTALSQAFSSPLTMLATPATWNVMIGGYDDATPIARLQINGQHHSQAGITSTDTDPVSGTQFVCAAVGPTRIPESGERWAGFAAFNVCLTEAQMAGLRTAIAGTRPGYA